MWTWSQRPDRNRTAGQMSPHTGEDSDKMTPLSGLGTTYDFLEIRHTSKEKTTGLN